MNEELLKLVAAALGIKTEEVTEDNIKEVKFLKVADFQKVDNDSKKVATLEQEKTALEATKVQLETDKVTLTGQVQTLTAAKVALEAEAAAGKVVLENARKTAKELYTKFANGTTDTKIVEELEKETDIVSLEAKAKMWGGQVYAKFGAKCGDCGSGKVSFRSSVEEDQDDPQKNKPVSEPLYLQVLGN